MRTAVICKRHYTGRDVLGDRFGRLYELPRQLSLRGHDVMCLIADYHGDRDEAATHEASPGTLRWRSFSFGGPRILRLARYPAKILSTLRSFGPEVIIGASDVPNVALAGWAARRLNVPCVTDLYDDFTSYGQAHIPGFKSALGRSIRKSDLVIAVSETLRQVTIDSWQPAREIVVIPNGVDTETFRELSPAWCRRHFKLPESGRLVGTAGGLYGSKGIGTLYSAWEKLKSMHEDIHLVLAGPHRPSEPPPSGERVHYLGNIPHSDVSILINALDVAVATAEDNAFGRSCFPQKAYEIIACKTPIAAANIGALGQLLASAPGHLYTAGDAESLAQCLIRQLENKSVPGIPVLQWAQVGKLLDEHIAPLASS